MRTFGVSSFASCLALALAAGCSAAPPDELASSSDQDLLMVRRPPPPTTWMCPHYGACMPDGHPQCLPDAPACAQQCPNTFPRCSTSALFGELGTKEQAIANQFNCVATGVWDNGVAGLGTYFIENYALCPDTQALHDWVAANAGIDTYSAHFSTMGTVCDACLATPTPGMTYVFMAGYNMEPTCSSGCMAPAHW